MLIVPDPAVDGQWHYCRDCHSKGDIIALAAKVWRMSNDATVAKLVQMGLLQGNGETLIQQIKRYEKMTKRLERINNLLESGKEYVITSKELSRIMNKLEIVSRATPERYRRTYGLIVGGSESIDVEAVFAPRNVVMNHAKARRKSAKAATRIFKTGWWGDVLFIPYYDLPGRVCRFQFIGRDGRKDLDWPMKYVSGPRDTKEAGLAFHPALIDKKPETVFAVEDMVIYLRLQALHHSKYDNVLPLINWYESLERRTDTAWRLFSTSKIVFWCWDMTPGTVLQAINNNGYICCSNLEDKTETGVRHFINRQTSEALLKQCDKQAKPWPEALEAWAERVPEEQVEDLLRQLQIRGCDIIKHLQRCSKALQTKAGKLLTTTTTRTVESSGGQVIEDNHGWFKVRKSASNVLISDAVLRLDKAIFNPIDRQTYYQGRVLFGEQEVQFCETRKTLEKDTFGWMHDLLLKERLGVMRYDHLWSNKAMNLAMLFSNVQQVDSLTRVGWSSRTNRMELPKFAIDHRGTVLEQDKALIFTSSPASRLEPPEPLTPLDLDQLVEDMPSSRVFWAGWLACAANILAPVIGRDTRGLVVTTDSAPPLVHAAYAACGCNYIPLTRKSFDTARDEEFKHDWPVMIGLQDQAQKVLLRELLESTTEPRNCVVRGNWWQGRVMSLAGWRMLEAEAEGIPAALAIDGHKLLPSFLRFFLEHHVRYPARDIATSVCEWLDSLHVRTNVVEEADKLFYDAAETAGELICKAIVEGSVQIMPNSTGGSLDAVVTRTQQGLFVPRLVLENVVDKKTAIRLDWDKMSSQLADTKQLVGETTFYDQPGVIVREEWLAQVRRRLQNDQTKRLKVVNE